MSNKTKSRNYSYIALIVALIAFIAAILLGITRGMVDMQMFTVASVENLNQYILISIGIGILGIAVYAILEPERVRRFFTGRQARHGSNAIITSLAIVGILIVGNLLAFENPKTIADLTEDNINTLSPELLSAVQALPEKVTATGFFSQSSTETADQLLSNIKAGSNGKFDYRFINPDLDPQAAINAGVTGDGKILLQMGDRSAIVAFASEDEILKGLLQLLNPESSAIYFLTGHGERDIEQSGESSMTRAASTLESKNYTVKTLNLLVDNEIPEGARVIVIAGPLQPVSENEVNLLKEFLDNGGSLIVMEDPIPLTEFGEESDPLADLLLREWGISLNNDIVIDLNSPQPTTAAAAYYDATHPITVNMNNLVSFYPFTRSIGMTDPVEGITLTSLVQTNERSWGETDFESLSEDGQVALDEGELVGPLALAMAGENPGTNGRVVVFGTSQFALDQIFDAYGNGDMFVNSVDWSAEQENLTSITSKDTTERTFIPPSQLYSILILLTSIFIIPGLVLVGGVSTWLTRRRQG
ncbi:MAG TPA: GldG family protein [Anaerolineales bacterium]|nr:GldG family protein [Anaerolineales bacterium]